MGLEDMIAENLCDMFGISREEQINHANNREQAAIKQQQKQAEKMAKKQNQISGKIVDGAKSGLRSRMLNTASGDVHVSEKQGGFEDTSDKRPLPRGLHDIQMDDDSLIDLQVGG